MDKQVAVSGTGTSLSAVGERITVQVRKAGSCPARSVVVVPAVPTACERAREA